MMTLGIDEIRTFESYYGAMAISKEQKKLRIGIAEAFLESLLFIFAYAKRIGKRPGAQAEIEAKLREAVIAVIPLQFKQDGVVTDQYMKGHIALFAASVAATTLKYLEGYYATYDRAFDLSADEGNILGNYGDYVDAVNAGKTKKTWITMRDERVRDTHIAVDGETIPIKDYFRVGASYMRFPLDQSLGASPGEIVGCRCIVSYT